MPSKKHKVVLTPEEREYLQTLIESRNTKSQQVKRAYALLASDENGEKGWSDDQISQVYGLSRASMERLRERLVLAGLQTAITGKKRAVIKERHFTEEIEAKLVEMLYNECPRGYNRWTFQLVADQMIRRSYVKYISGESVRRILKKMNISLGG